MKKKGKIIEDFEACEQTPQISILQMEDFCRNSIDILWAEKICESFGCKLDKNLIRRMLVYREQTTDTKAPRVIISSLARYICEQLGLTPDEQLMGTANKMFGVGSMKELATQSCCKMLRKKFSMPEEY